LPAASGPCRADEFLGSECVLRGQALRLPRDLVVRGAVGFPSCGAAAGVAAVLAGPSRWRRLKNSSRSRGHGVAWWAVRSGRSTPASVLNSSGRSDCPCHPHIARSWHRPAGRCWTTRSASRLATQNRCRASTTFSSWAVTTPMSTAGALSWASIGAVATGGDQRSCADPSTCLAAAGCATTTRQRGLSQPWRPRRTRSTPTGRTAWWSRCWSRGAVPPRTRRFPSSPRCPPGVTARPARPARGRRTHGDALGCHPPARPFSPTVFRFRLTR
jgi:hypothetical protein